MPNTPSIRLLAVALVLAPAVSSPALAQERKADSTRTLRTVTVTATRAPTDVRQVPAPVTVYDSASIREKSPNSAADLLREAPGVDVVGTGPNQGRPSIRGQRGQRILLLQDGLRLNNNRRQQDFGELPALVDVDQIERVEVVRGPSSVLYGSDAIGGVINLITRTPRADGTTRVRGNLGYRYSGAGEQQRGDGSLTVTRGAFAFTGSGSLRNAGNYEVPGGSFGDLTLPDGIKLDDSGVRDRSLNLYASWRGQGRSNAWIRHDRYVARDAGFGFVEPRILGDTSTRIKLTYPWQAVQKTSAGINLSSLGLPFADRVDLSLYTQGNKRDFDSFVDVYVPTGPGRTAVINSRSYNTTDVGSSGLRLEAAKVLSRVVFTYGLDAVRDDAVANDSAYSRTTGFGPNPIISSSTRPSLPDADMRNVGLFLQGDWRLHERFSVITGVRYHDVHAETRQTAGLPDSVAGLKANNRTTVYAVNGIYRLTDHVSAVATYGRGFRAPNLIERYFSGPSTDGTAIQVANPGLDAETSTNVDVGLRVSVARVEAEWFYFRNNLKDGILTRPTGRTIGRLAEFQNINVERLRTSGHEATLRVDLGRGFDLNTNYTKLETKNPDRPDIPVAGTYSSKLNAALGYRPRGGRFWAEGAVRRQGEQQDINLGTSPIGSVLPAFTIVNVRGGVRLATIAGRPQEVGLGINNLGNALYAEAANSAFVRPEAGRHVVLSVRSSF
ncbi:MAG: TonB-dependent receptor [Gemmatimonadetes bacterium]|nr:TonB-dependent receptor [Gemmatimonadota bacterium]MBK7832586.1 TonB-dependent receptor [Gemmatimonadota bacterium]MBK9410303.1 TonB-dependent receptor [Gemmatimonadota bacterium]